MRGHLLCWNCRFALTGSASRSQNGTQYLYYHCNKCQKKESRHRAMKLNSQFEDYLTLFEFNPDIITLYRFILSDVMQNSKIHIKSRLKTISSTIKKKEKESIKAQELLLESKIDSKIYKKMHDRLEQEINELDLEGHKLRESNKNQADQISFGLNLLNNLSTHYIQSNIELKHKLLSSIFPTKLLYHNKQYRTEGKNILDNIMTLKNRDLEAMEKEKAIENDGSSIRAPVARLELATRGLTVRCSNQLSYTGIVDSALRVWQNQIDNLLTFEY